MNGGLPGEKSDCQTVAMFGTRFWYWFYSQGSHHNDFSIIVKFRGLGMSTAQKYYQFTSAYN